MRWHSSVSVRSADKGRPLTCCWRSLVASEASRQDASLRPIEKSATSTALNAFHVAVTRFFLSSELKWLKTVDPAKADKAATRALAQAKMD